MNYTQNYRLPQWEKSDRILMDDFNLAMSGIEDGLNAAVVHADAAASQAESSASSLAAQAQTTANNALNAAASAQAAASKAFTPSYLPFQAGTYVGNGATLNIYLGFQPSFVILTGQFIASGIDYVNNTILAGPSLNMSSYVTFTDTGMTLLPPANTSSPVNLNQNGRSYNYIAFR